MSPLLTKDRQASTARLVERLRALGEAVELCRGRVDAAAVERAESLIQRADRRLALSGDATVVALAGATGSGKSSLFNALIGGAVATVGVRRPTTSTALAASWGEGRAAELLDWLGVPQRHIVTTGGAGSADGSRTDGRDGLVFLDLPDHDSVVTAHRQEAERLVELVDLLVWVVDPQKYADAALHERYLAPLARHADAMLVVLNQADRLGAHQRDECVRDLGRLLASEGLKGVPVVATSAATGEGLPELQRRLTRLAAGKHAAAARLAADLDAAAAELAAACGNGRSASVPARAVSEMNRSLADAAGVPAVTDAVAKAWRRRGAMATGWPVVSWLGRLRPDPLRRLHLDRWRLKSRDRAELTAGPTGATVGRTSLPAATGIQSARVDAAVRALADETAQGLPRGWLTAVKTAARSRGDELPDALDQAIARADLDIHRHRRWWQLIRVVQWLLIATVVLGLAWLTWGFLLAYLQLPPPPRVSWAGLPAATVLAVGGVLAGFLVAGFSRIGVEVGARRRSRQAARTLRADIAKVTAELVVNPVTAELAGYGQAVAALERARR
ncbi:MAG: GTPase [Propionibacteriaceae bacterium]